MPRVPRAGVLVAAALLAACVTTIGQSAALPMPSTDEPLAATKTMRAAVVSGGCFWGIQLVFEHVKGVSRVLEGYAGGAASTAQYDTVSTGRTGHAESVEITYDASVVTYGQLLRVFFGVAHDPTQLNRQGPDEGTQYRSAIFFQDADQQRIARAYVAQLTQARAFNAPIVTAIVQLPAFYRAEDYHQGYADEHPDDLYIRINDAPKLAALKRVFPDLYTARAASVRP
jgi:peptide-methionine (S)-S-oxide reductase